VAPLTQPKECLFDRGNQRASRGERWRAWWSRRRQGLRSGDLSLGRDAIGVLAKHGWLRLGYGLYDHRPCDLTPASLSSHLFVLESTQQRGVWAMLWPVVAQHLAMQGSVLLLEPGEGRPQAMQYPSTRALLQLAAEQGRLADVALWDSTIDWLADDAFLYTLQSRGLLSTLHIPDNRVHALGARLKAGLARIAEDGTPHAPAEAWPRGRNAAAYPTPPLLIVMHPELVSRLESVSDQATLGYASNVAFAWMMRLGVLRMLQASQIDALLTHAGIHMLISPGFIDVDRRDLDRFLCPHWERALTGVGMPSQLGQDTALVGGRGLTPQAIRLAYVPGLDASV
jgi:hypothetical protein